MPQLAEMPLVHIHAPNDLRTDTVAIPELGDSDVLLRVKVCGICGSDLSYAKLGGIPGARTPFALGHEFSAEIIEVGSAVKDFTPGERVVVNPEVGDNGIGSAGYKGAFAPYLLYENAVDYPQGIIRLPDTLSYEIGAMVEPLSVGMHGVNQASVHEGDKVVVFGAGPVGLSAALVARYFGAASVVVVDLSDRRLEVARELGLVAYQAADNDLAGFLRSEHGVDISDPRLGEMPASDVFIEATGVGGVFQQACDIARKGARISVVGVHFAGVEMNMINLLMKELRIVGSMAYVDEFTDVISMLESGKVDVTPLITHSFPLSKFDAAFNQAQQQDEAVKVLVDCQE